LDVIGVDRSVVDRSARVLKYHAKELPKIDVYDEKYYPPAREDPERVALYFLVMVAMDHRLSRPGKVYAACLEDGCYKGADLLYRLGALKYREDPDFFRPEKLANIKLDEVKSWLSVGGAEPPDLDVRTMLLRDLGLKLIKLYDSSALKVLELSNRKIRGTPAEPGLVDNLKVFRAYEDPVEKKAMLLAKFLIARGLFNPTDPESLEVAVDNHLTRIALRMGLVMVSGPLWDKIKAGVEVEYEEDLLIRLVVRRAYKFLALKSGLSAGAVDDFFWIMGRTTCLRDEQPKCEKCLFKGFCRARKSSAFMVNEHTYYSTWYY
jgi:hypothetical protein